MPDLSHVLKTRLVPSKIAHRIEHIHILLETIDGKVGRERCSDRGLDVNSATCFVEYFLRSVRPPTRYRPVRAKLWIIAGRPFFKVGRADLARCINNQRPRDGRAGGQLRGVPRATITMRTKRTKGGFQSVSCEPSYRGGGNSPPLPSWYFLVIREHESTRPEIFQIRVSPSASYFEFRKSSRNYRPR